MSLSEGEVMNVKAIKLRQCGCETAYVIFVIIQNSKIDVYIESIEWSECDATGLRFSLSRTSDLTSPPRVALTCITSQQVAVTGSG